MDGIEAAEKINEKQDVQIIFMTGYSRQDYIERATKINPLVISINRLKWMISILLSGNASVQSEQISELYIKKASFCLIVNRMLLPSDT